LDHYCAERRKKTKLVPIGADPAWVIEGARVNQAHAGAPFKGQADGRAALGAELLSGSKLVTKRTAPQTQPPPCVLAMFELPLRLRGRLRGCLFK